MTSNDSPRSPSLRPSRLSPFAVAALLGFTALCMVAPTLRLPARWADPYDWRYFEAMEEAFRTSVVEFHQAPLWNPYACGGEVGLANPQSTAFAPTFLFSLLFGTPLAMKLSLLCYLFFALHGAWLLARTVGVSPAGALVSGIAYGTCGWFAMHLSSGHINFAGAALYPYLVYFYLRAVGAPADRRREARETATQDDPDRAENTGFPRLFFVIPAGFVIAWMAGLGGTYTVPMGVILIAVWAATDAVAERSLRPILIGAAIGLSGLLLGAARLLPLLEFVSQHPRHVGESDANNAFDVARMFLAWRHWLEPTDGNHVYWWHEYCCHLPYLAFALAMLAAVFHRRPSVKVLLPAALFAAWTALSLAVPAADHYLARHLLGYRDAYHLVGVLAFVLLTRGSPVARTVPLVVVALGIVAGTAWPHGPWWLVRMLPVFHDLRVPSRYLILVALALALWAGYGFDRAVAWLAARRPGPAARRFAAAAVAVVLVEGLLFTVPTYDDARFVTERTAPSVSPPFYQNPGEWRDMLEGVIDRRGTLNCDEEAPLQRGELDPGPGEQVRLLDPGAGTVTLERWTPNQLTFALDLERPTDVLVNQNWNEHWLLDGAGAGDTTAVKSIAGRLAFAAEAGKKSAVLRYRPRSFIIGAWVSALSLLAAALCFCWAAMIERRRREWPARPSPSLRRR